HPGEDPDDPAFVDVPDYPFFVLALEVVLRNRSLFDQRHPGLLTRGVDHQDVGHRRILVTGPRARRRTLRANAAERRSARARKRMEKPGRTLSSCLRADEAARGARIARRPVCSPETRPSTEQPRALLKRG